MVWSSRVAATRCWFDSEHRSFDEQAAVGRRPRSSHRAGTRAEASSTAPRFVIAPLVPLVAAVALGIVLDRYVEPWETRKWAGLTLVLAAIARFCWRAGRLICVALRSGGDSSAFGGGWHHHRWSDMDPDDLAFASPRRRVRPGFAAWCARRSGVRHERRIRVRGAGRRRGSRPGSCST